MGKTVVYSDVKVSGLTLILSPDGKTLTVQAAYSVLDANGQAVQTKQTDITKLVPVLALPALKALFPQARDLILPTETT